jgi:hypothetical protein
MKARVCVSIALLVLATACNKKPHEEPTTEPSAVIEAPSASASAVVAPSDSTAALSDEADVEVPEDLADDAAEEITPQNLDKELATLEKEIGSET